MKDLERERTERELQHQSAQDKIAQELAVKILEAGRQQNLYHQQMTNLLMISFISSSVSVLLLVIVGILTVSYCRLKRKHSDLKKIHRDQEMIMSKVLVSGSLEDGVRRKVSGEVTESKELSVGTLAKMDMLCHEWSWPPDSDLSMAE